MQKLRTTALVSSLLIVAALPGCSDEEAVIADQSRSSSAAVITTACVSLYPISFPLDADMLAGADAAQAQSKALDDRCATLPIAAALHSKRPKGTGCPRSEDVVEVAQ